MKSRIQRQILNSESGVFSEYREHEGIDKGKPDLKENIPPEYQGNTNSIVDDLYNQLGVEYND